MRRRAMPSAATLALATATLALAARVAVAEVGEPVPAGPPTVTTTVAGPRLAVEVEGRLLDLVWRRDGEGGRVGLLLVAVANDPDGPRHLLELRLGDGFAGSAGGGSLVRSTDALPADAESLALHPLAEGDAVLLGAPGRVELLAEDPAGTREILWRAPGLDLRARPVSEGSAPGTLMLAAPGRLAIFAPGRPRPSARREVPLPVRVGRTRSGLVRETPAVTALPRAALSDGAATPTTGDVLLVVGPEAVGATRLRTLVIDPWADDPAAARWETWSRLPGPESLRAHRYVVQDDRARLLVSTVDADQVALLGRQRLRSLPLLRDRSRAGVATSLDAELAARHWQRVALAVSDTDGDVHDDLVTIAEDGLGGGKLTIEAHPGRGTGRYAPRPRATTLDRRADAWHFGADLTADGLPDLLIVGQGHLELFAGQAAGRRLVARKSFWSVPVAPSDGPPTLLDVDGDGDLDIVLATRHDLATAPGRGRVQVLLRGRETD